MSGDQPFTSDTVRHTSLFTQLTYLSKRNKFVEMANRSTPTFKNVGDCSPKPPRIDVPGLGLEVRSCNPQSASWLQLLGWTESERFSWDQFGWSEMRWYELMDMRTLLKVTGTDAACGPVSESLSEEPHVLNSTNQLIRSCTFKPQH